MSSGIRAGATAAEFDRAAPRYDLLVTLNPGYHRHLRAAADALVAALPGERLALVDLGCGSGASTRALLAAAGLPRTASMTGIDASAGMLAQARRKRWPRAVQFVQGRAEQVATLLPRPVDGVLAAYLFRNVAAADRDAAVRAVHDVLAPGGVLVVQEYSVAGRAVPAALWTLVCWAVVIPLALLTSGRTRLYRYLWRSVLDFDRIEAFAARLRRAGFTDVRVGTVRGWQRGILHTVVAHRPR